VLEIPRLFGRGRQNQRRTSEFPRVLVLSNLFPNNAQPGRAPFNRQQFAHLGQRTRVHVEAVIPWQFGRNKTATICREETIEGLTVCHPRYPSVPGVPILNAGLLAGRLIRSFRARATDFDVILASYAYPDGCAGVLLGRALGLPVVVKCHGSDLNRVPDDRGPRIQLRKLLPLADAVVVVSAKLGEAAQAIGVCEEKIHVVYNGVDHERFKHQERAQAREALAIDQGVELIVCVSHLDEHKGTLDLLDAIEDLANLRPGVTVAFVGDGPLLETVQQRARRIPKDKATIMAVGRVDHTQVPTWMAASDYVTLPSWDEGMPNVVREAHVMGRAVIATDVGGIPEAVHTPVLGTLVPRKNPQALAQALAAALQKGAPQDLEVTRAASISDWGESAEALLAVLTKVTD
jgi:teichuronic acid biosynthesis glycosyltransferase TuaC